MGVVNQVLTQVTGWQDPDLGARRGEKKVGGRGDHRGLDEAAEVDTAHCFEPFPTKALNCPYLTP